MPRKTNEELDKLKEKLQTDTLWSWSRYHTYCQDSWEYFLKYILHIPEDRQDSIYTFSGAACHDILERYYNGEITQSQMYQEYEDILMTFGTADLKYDRNDNNKNEKIANKYEGCMKHFFKNHHKPESKHMVNEQFVLIHISDDIYFQGYIDNLELFKDDKGNIHAIITDYKTSTIYKGEKLHNESGQLYLYAEGIKQKLSIPIENVTVRYLFMKYVIIHCKQANGKWNTRQIERIQIGEKLANSIKMWLKKLGYEDKIDEYLEEVLLSNSIDCLPLEVKERFKIEDCYVEIPLNQGIIDELKKEVSEIITEIKDKNIKYTKTQDEQIWWQDVTPADEYYHAMLSGYSRLHHKPYDYYLCEQEMFNTNENNEEDDVDELLRMFEDDEI